MKDKVVLYSTENGIAKITLNRPQQLNAFNEQMLKELGEAIDNARLDQMVKVTILTGQGKSFCAGGDLAEIRRLNQSSPMEIYLFMRELNGIVKKVVHFPKPLLTAVNGVALGGGCCFALAGDVVIVSERATFGFVFSRFNLIADTGASFILSRLVGTLRAKDLIFSGRIFSAKEAKDYGLVSELASDDNFDVTIVDRARQMAEWSTEAISMNKWILEKAAGGSDLETLLEIEARTQATLFGGARAHEKIKNFLKAKKS